MNNYFRIKNLFLFKLRIKNILDVIYLIDQFLGHESAYKWKNGNYFKCIYCGCPKKYKLLIYEDSFNIFCKYPFNCINSYIITNHKKFTFLIYKFEMELIHENFLLYINKNNKNEMDKIHKKIINLIKSINNIRSQFKMIELY